MIHTVRTYINTHQLLTGKKPVIVGLSGGADSVALLSILIRLGYTCIAAHCNFHLRGEESYRDEQFAENIAKNYSIPFYKKDFETNRYAKEKHISVEMAARELRYHWFEEMRKQLHAQAIAVAHHRDDNVETVLLNLTRGTGIRGLRGMRPKNGYIIRPLLAIGREEILSWLAKEKRSFVTDSTNLSDEYTRNFLRLRVIPLLEEINPAAKETVSRTAEHISEVENIYHAVIEQAKKTVIIENDTFSIAELMKYPSPGTILYELLNSYGFTRIVTEEIFSALSKESGKTFYSATHRLIKDRSLLLITSLDRKTPSIIHLEKEEGSCSQPIALSWHKQSVTEDFQIEKNKCIAYFDYDLLTFPLTLRTWKPGDWFVPFGQKGRKKISDYYSDHKFSLIKKEETWLLCNENDIIWVVGERADNRYRVTKSTNYALIVNFSPKKQGDK